FSGWLRVMSLLLHVIRVLFFFFFFQAEDGIRDGHVTGVQTCALPIWPSNRRSTTSTAPPMAESASRCTDSMAAKAHVDVRIALRSEERRVGKECRSRGSPYQ